MKKLKFVVWWVFILILTYFAIVFITLEYNILKWHGFMRYFFVVFAVYMAMLLFRLADSGIYDKRI